MGLSQSCTNTYILCDLNDNAPCPKQVHLRCFCCSSYAFVTMCRMVLISTSPAIRICFLVGALTHLNLMRGHPLLRITSLRFVWEASRSPCVTPIEGRECFFWTIPSMASTENNETVGIRIAKVYYYHLTSTVYATIRGDRHRYLFHRSVILQRSGRKCALNFLFALSAAR